MKAFFAIMCQTVRSALRAKVFHVLVVFILLAVFLLPVTVSGDGTLNGLVRISLSYSLGVVICLISATALWLSCSQLSREIENYTVHLNVTKPCPRWKLWLGKWVGIFGMHAVILLVSMWMIFGLIQWRVSYGVRIGRFSQEELEKLNKEIRVGLRTFYPRMPELVKAVEQIYQKEKDKFAGSTEQEAKRKILMTVQQRDSEVKPRGRKEWEFRGVRGSGKELYLRYRGYAGSTDSFSQKEIGGCWGLRPPSSGSEGSAEGFVYQRTRFMGGTYQSLPISVQAIDTARNDAVNIAFWNYYPLLAEGETPAPEQSVVFQMKDGPVLLMANASFAENYFRATLLALLQIAFLTALGCTFSAAFSTPVAMFMAVAYLVIGMTVNAAVDAPLKNPDGTYAYKNVAEHAAHVFARGVGHVVVSVKDLDAISDLSSGRMVENARILDALLGLLLLRTGVLVAIGIWVLEKRELGLVVRK